MTPLPTLQEQRAAGLETIITDHITAAIARLPRPPTEAVPPVVRTLPRGVYRDSTALYCNFTRRLNGRQDNYHVARGAPGDFSAETAQRLARECAAAALAWDEAHRR